MTCVHSYDHEDPDGEEPPEKYLHVSPYFCHQCGERFPALPCPACGKLLTPDSIPMTPESTFCHHCEMDYLLLQEAETEFAAEGRLMRGNKWKN